MRYVLLAALAGMVGNMLNAEPIETVRVDLHERLYPDRWPEQVERADVSVPRGAPVTLQFAVRSQSDGDATLRLTGNLPGKARLHWLQSIHVEGNTQGSLINRPGGKVPDGWLENHLVRAAPFDTLEAAIEGDRISMVSGRTHGVVVEISVPSDTEPGPYKGELHVTLGNDESVVPFVFRVHRTVLPDTLPLHSVHWLWAEPVNLTNGEIPEWWSERHWQLLETAGKQLLRFGDDTVFTPLTHSNRGELIQIMRRKDGTFAFDYSRFDRWCKLYLGLGFRYISGRHIVNMGAETYVTDEATGKREPLLKDPKSKDEWLAFLPTFYKSFRAHLEERGWLEHYMQCQYDEPRDEQLYRKLAELARKHMPGVPTCDAINNRANRFSPLVDTQVFSLLQLNKHQSLAAERNANGQGVWLYHCTSPYPPNPNRHIDSHLTESRLYPWLCRKLGANGFLFWAANGYRGADEYKTSIGPFPPPRNNQNPGHPPGDNWFYYRTPEGLQPSVRIFSHREGLIDYALLKELEKRDQVMPEQLVMKIAHSISQFQRDPAAYHQARTEILKALDSPDRTAASKADKVACEKGTTFHEVAVKAVRPAGAPEYADVCFRYGWIRSDGPASVENAKKAIRAFHATRVDWFYPGSHTMQPGATYVTQAAKDFIDWCHSNDMKIGGAMNNNTTDPAWGYRKHHLTRYVGDVRIPEFAEMAVAWGKSQIDAGVDTIVCDDIFKYDAARKQLWSDNVLAKIKAYKEGFTMAGNNGSSIGTDYVKRYAVDFHYSDNNFVPKPGAMWSASKAHRALKSAFLLHPNRPRTTTVHRGMIALAYAAGAHVITPWDEYIHGGKRLFADPADFADLYGFARGLGQLGYLNGYEDAAVGGYDLKETRYEDAPPIAVSGGSGRLSVFARAKPGRATAPVVIHLVETGEPKPATLRFRGPALFRASKVACTLLTPPVYKAADHSAAESSENYAALASASEITPRVEDDVFVVDVAPLKPWGVLVVAPERKDHGLALPRGVIKHER